MIASDEENTTLFCLSFMTLPSKVARGIIFLGCPSLRQYTPGLVYAI